MFDINSAGYDELDEMLVTLKMLKAYKMLYDFGIHLPAGEKRDIKFDEDDCLYSGEQLSSQFTALLTNNEVEVNMADNERGKMIGYELFFDEEEDGPRYYEYIIHQPDIVEYFNYWKRKAGYPDPMNIKNAYEYIKDDTFTNMIDMLIQNSPNDYGVGYASFVSNTFELIFLVSDDMYMKYDSDIMINLMELVIYCQDANEQIRLKEEAEAERVRQEEFKKKEEEIKCLAS